MKSNTSLSKNVELFIKKVDDNDIIAKTAASFTPREELEGMPQTLHCVS